MRTLRESILDKDFDVNLTNHIFGDELLEVLFRYDWRTPSGKRLVPASTEYRGDLVSTKSSAAMGEIMQVIEKIMKQTPKNDQDLAEVYWKPGHVQIVHKSGYRFYTVIHIRYSPNNDTWISWQMRNSKDADTSGKLIGRVPFAIERTIQLGVTG